MLPRVPTNISVEHRKFLFLQGPPGPFFRLLRNKLVEQGASVRRINFSGGDKHDWPDDSVNYAGLMRRWPLFFDRVVLDWGITDLVLFGDCRPVHKVAIRLAQLRGIHVHVFEEGYMRPYWVSYERGGTNGNSRLMDLSVEDMQAALALSDLEVPTPPAHWGDMRHHVLYGAIYHWFVLFRNSNYRKLARHRELPVLTEAALYTRRLLLMPFIALDRILATARIRFGGFPYHLVLMQLEHDASFQMHSPFTRMGEFITVVLEGFAKGTPRHHHLVFKAHPLENGGSPLRQIIRDEAKRLGVEDRVHYVRGGKLAQLLDHARTSVTVNSTAGQQVLWRGIPLKVFGKAVYNKPEFVSEQPLDEFFANPTSPDSRAFKDYRRFLLETSQVPDGFYSARGRRQLMRQVVDMMLSDEDPYDSLKSGKVPPRQPLRIVN